MHHAIDHLNCALESRNTMMREITLYYTLYSDMKMENRVALQNTFLTFMTQMLVTFTQSYTDGRSYHANRSFNVQVFKCMTCSHSYGHSQA